MREEVGKVGDIRWLLAGCVSTSSNVQARTQEALPKVCHALEGFFFISLSADHLFAVSF